MPTKGALASATSKRQSKPYDSYNKRQFNNTHQNYNKDISET